MSKHRNTGRTSRMIDEALRLSASGVPVQIYTGTIHYAEQLRQNIFHEFLRCYSNDSPSRVYEKIKVEVVPPFGQFNWHTMTVPGLPPGCVVLVDHSAIEDRFTLMLKMLHKFDLQENPES